MKTTNNRMELMAAIVGLEALNRPCQVELYSDSKYLTDAFNQRWVEGWIKKNWTRGKNEPVKNVDLWQRLLAAAAPHEVQYNLGERPRRASGERKMRSAGYFSRGRRGQDRGPGNPGGLDFQVEMEKTL